MNNYQQIKEDLDIHIQEVKKILDLVEELKSSKRIPTQEEALFLQGKRICNGIERRKDNATPLTSEEIALILETKAKTDQTGSIDYQPILIDGPEAFDSLSKIVENNIKEHIPFQYNIIIKGLNPFFSIVHCTPLQMNFDGKNLQNFYLDSAGDQSFATLKIRLDKMSKNNEHLSQHYFFPNKNEEIQRDNFNCSIFSIQDLNTMYKLSKNLTKYLLINNNALADLHPKFVKNAQSISLLANYSAKSQNKDLFVSKDKALDEYISNYRVSIELADSTKITQNRAIDYKKLKYLESAKKLLDDTYQKGGEQAVQKLLEQRTGGIIFNQHQNQCPLKQEVKDIASSLSEVNKVNSNRSKSKLSPSKKSGVLR